MSEEKRYYSGIVEDAWFIFDRDLTDEEKVDHTIVCVSEEDANTVLDLLNNSNDNTELGEKLMSVWIDHCSEDASSGPETLEADLDEGYLLYEAACVLTGTEPPQ